MVVSDLRALVPEYSAADLTHWSLSSSRHRSAIMHFLLFMFEMVLVLGGIALVPARSELLPSRNIERERENSLRS